jgi:cbb3-type cytochrome oxidase subunit 1
MILIQAAIGIIIGAAVFAAAIWSAAQSYLKTGRLRYAHLALLTLTLAGMACVSLMWPVVATVIGIALIIAGLYAVLIEERWNKLLPLAQAILGLALVAGLPFS